MDRQQFSDHDLLIRIDERRENIAGQQECHEGKIINTKATQDRYAGIMLALWTIGGLAIHTTLWLMSMLGR